MRKRPGVYPYEGPEKMYEEKIKNLVEDAEFVLKFLRYQDLAGFEIAVFLKEKATKEIYIVRRHTEEF